MQTNAHLARELRERFIARWPLKKLEEMTLEQYTSTKRTGPEFADTFTYWVERETKDLGSISGANSSKFGIWKRKYPSVRKPSFQHDEAYSWTQYKNNPKAATSAEAYVHVRAELLEIVNASQSGNYHLIDRKGILKEMFKWKIAYLYSNEGLVPIFSRKVLIRIAWDMGVQQKEPPTSEIQRVMMNYKKPWDTIYTYGMQLFTKYSRPEDDEKLVDDNGMYDDDEYDGNNIDSDIEQASNRRRKGRRAQKGPKNTDTRWRKGTDGLMVNPEHDILQNKLKAELEKWYEGEVELEHNYVDLKASRDKEWHYFEVKCDGTAARCVEEALGQILRYLHYHNQAGIERVENVTRLFVAGKARPTPGCLQYIAFVKSLIPEPTLDYICIHDKEDLRMTVTSKPPFKRK